MYCLHPKSIVTPDGVSRQVPCGKCVVCMRRYQMEWTARLAIELQSASSAWFITLTYDDEHLPDPRRLRCRDRDGNLYICCFDKRQVQRFLKRFFAGKKNMRYYLCSEYGDNNYRPHYHMILYNYQGSEYDLRFELAKKWPYCEDAMFMLPASVEPVSMGSIKYVTGYALKRHDVPHGFEKPWSLKSNGLGRNYLTTDNIKFHKNTLSNFISVEGEHFAFPRYLKDKIFNEEEKLMLAENNRRYICNTNYNIDRRNMHKYGWSYQHVYRRQWRRIDDDVGNFVGYEPVDTWFYVPVDASGRLATYVDPEENIYAEINQSSLKSLLKIKNRKKVL